MVTIESLLHCYCSEASISHVPPYIMNYVGNATKDGTKIMEHNDIITEKAKHTHTQKQGNINHFANMQHIKSPTTLRQVQHEKNVPRVYQ